MAKMNETSRKAYAFLRDHPGVIYHFRDVADAIGMSESAESVGASLYRFKTRKPGMGIVASEQAGHFVFLPEKATGTPPPPPEPAKTTPMVFEEVGTSQDGSIIVRDEKGILYRLGGLV